MGFISKDNILNGPANIKWPIKIDYEGYPFCFRSFMVRPHICPSAVLEAELNVHLM